MRIGKVTHVVSLEWNCANSTVAGSLVYPCNLTDLQHIATEKRRKNTVEITLNLLSTLLLSNQWNITQIPIK